MEHYDMQYWHGWTGRQPGLEGLEIENPPGFIGREVGEESLGVRALCNNYWSCSCRALYSGGQ